MTRVYRYEVCAGTAEETNSTGRPTWWIRKERSPRSGCLIFTAGPGRLPRHSHNSPPGDCDACTQGELWFLAWRSQVRTGPSEEDPHERGLVIQVTLTSMFGCVGYWVWYEWASGAAQ